MARDQQETKVTIQVTPEQLEEAESHRSFWGPAGLAGLGGSATGFWEDRPELRGHNLGVDWREIRSTQVARRYNRFLPRLDRARSVRNATQEKVGHIFDQHEEDQAGSAGGGVFSGVPTRGSGMNSDRYASDQ